MQRQLLAFTCVCGLASASVAQEAIPRPGWLPDTSYNLVHPKQFDAEDVANMLIELPNRPRRAGEKGSLGPELMFPPRPQYAVPPSAAAGPEQFVTTPFGPVARTLQRPQHVNGPRPKARHARRKPLTW